MEDSDAQILRTVLHWAEEIWQEHKMLQKEEQNNCKQNFFNTNQKA